EDAFDVAGDVVLGVPQVEMTGPALEVAEDDTFGLAETGPAIRSARRLRRGLLELEKVGEAEAQQSRAAHTQQLAPRNSIARIASWSSGNHQHGRSPLCGLAALRRPQFGEPGRVSAGSGGEDTSQQFEGGVSLSSLLPDRRGSVNRPVRHFSKR